MMSATPSDEQSEVARILQICNACRYCEGFCAVFPAMTRRLEFARADVNYLANLCHNCGACLHACQYAPPHEFAVNVPQSMARVRGQTYADYALPPVFGKLYQRNGLTLSLVLTAALSFFLMLGAILDGGHGQGCNEADDAWTLVRRRCHHLTFYGFMLCFAATALATVYHYVFGWIAPYDLPSVPKLLGAVGGVMLMLGTVGLWRVNRARHSAHGDAKQKPMDLGFIALLFVVAASGMALWLARATPALALLLCLHLGAVMALFMTLPYGKFAHGVFRTAALLRHATEKRLPNPVGVGGD